MYTKQVKYSRILAMLSLTILYFSQSSQASVLSFNFEDAAGDFETSADTFDPGIVATEWLTQQGSVLDFTGDPGRALGARTFANGNALQLRLVVADGLALSIDSFAFDHFASSTGPQAWQLRINGDELASGAAPASFASANGDLMLDNLVGEISLAIVGTQASSNGGTYRIDNFVLNGVLTPVPLPPSVALLAIALGFISRRHRI